MALPATASLPQNGSIVSRWLLGEASGNRSDSVGSNTLTDNNTVGSTPGNNATTAADFESSNTEYLSIADNASLSIVGDLTMSIWVKFESLGSAASLMTKYQTSTDAKSWLWAKNASDDLYFLASSDGTTGVSNTVTWSPSTGVWYHLVVKYDASAGTAHFYVNGSQQGSTQTGYPNSINNNASDFRIGSWNSGGSPAWLLDAAAEDAIIWSHALSNAEVSDLYDAYAGSAFSPKTAFFL